ncbi:hypothetical protein ACF0H5_022094 [Mactra antiquata]
MSWIVMSLAFICGHILLADSGCPLGWIKDGLSCYHFSHDTESFVIADLLCKKMGGQLAEVNTEEESIFLAEHAANISHKFWIGLTDIDNEGDWRWYNSKASLIQTNVTNWAKHEPDNTGDNENCAILGSHHGLWWDHSCHEFNRFVCEVEDESSVDVFG